MASTPIHGRKKNSFTVLVYIQAKNSISELIKIKKNNTVGHWYYIETLLFTIWKMGI